MRGHESIMIYRLKRAKFYETRGPYQDVRVPGVMFDIVSIEGIKRYIGDLQYAIKHKGFRGMRQSYQRSDAYKHLKPKLVALNLDSNFTNVWSFQPANTVTYNKGGKEHPTAKPVEIMSRLIEMLSPENGVILDPFGGSGTTALAGLNTNRNVISIEKELEYHETSKKRVNAWHKEPKQDDLFD